MSDFIGLSFDKKIFYEYVIVRSSRLQFFVVVVWPVR